MKTKKDRSTSIFTQRENLEAAFDRLIQKPDTPQFREQVGCLMNLLNLVDYDILRKERNEREKERIKQRKNVC